MSEPQYLHVLAAGFRSSERHAGHVLVGGGSPNTVLPRRAMTNSVRRDDQEIHDRHTTVQACLLLQ